METGVKTMPMDGTQKRKSYQERYNAFKELIAAQAAFIIQNAEKFDQDAFEEYKVSIKPLEDKIGSKVMKKIENLIAEKLGMEVPA